MKTKEPEITNEKTFKLQLFENKYNGKSTLKIRPSKHPLLSFHTNIIFNSNLSPASLVALTEHIKRIALE